ncbi:MAG: peroxiredoxin [Methylococcaceae bacterium]|jgi:peroxiredoxin
MKQFFLICLLSCIALAANAALKEGDTAPDFSAQASLAGKASTYTLKEALQKGPVVVYFYPSAYTNGCNLQAHSFAAQYDKVVAAGASLVGVSLDDISRLNEFSADPEFCAGKFPVASDADGKISKSYGLTVKDAESGKKDSKGHDIQHGFAERTTFVITPDGKIAAAIGGLKAKENVDKTLDVLQHLVGSH